RQPGLAAWLRFRTGCIVGHVADVRRVIEDVNRSRAHPFLLGAYLFAPSLAPLVGQGYAALAPLLDVVSPMLYRTLTPGDACLTTEHAALAALRLLPSHTEFTAADVGSEVQAARAALAPAAALVPILQLLDDSVVDVTRAATTAGADAVDYFIYRPGAERYVELAAAVR
ncbi:MAG TPA: hypothetical protein VFX49_18845, partial [Chloroflexota bacterium]|nr:hypothetical protein [Chloroflexota bacterium]